MPFQIRMKYIIQHYSMAFIHHHVLAPLCLSGIAVGHVNKGDPPCAHHYGPSPPLAHCHLDDDDMSGISMSSTQVGDRHPDGQGLNG